MRFSVSYTLYTGAKGTAPTMTGNGIVGIRDLNATLDTDLIDVSERSVINKQWVWGMDTVSLQGSVLGGSAGFTTLMDAFKNKTVLSWGVKGRGSELANGDGYWFDGFVKSMSASYNRDGAADFNFEIWPTSEVTYV